jgi:TPP-dependent 2-oxoacid decarboxylase
MKQLGIQMIAAYSPQARGRSERAFQTHQDRLVKELSLHGITTMDEANRYLAQVYMPAFNAEFKKPASEEGSAFVPWVGEDLDDILCEHYERTVSADNCVRFDGMTLQIPENRYRCHYVRVKVQVHRYIDGSLAIFHGPRKLADYDSQGKLKKEPKVA